MTRRKESKLQEFKRELQWFRGRKLNRKGRRLVRNMVSVGLFALLITVLSVQLIGGNAVDPNEIKEKPSNNQEYHDGDRFGDFFMVIDHYLEEGQNVVDMQRFYAPDTTFDFLEEDILSINKVESLEELQPNTTIKLLVKKLWVEEE